MGGAAPPALLDRAGHAADRRLAVIGANIARVNGRQFVIAILVQGGIAVLTILCVTLLAALHDLDAQSVVGVLGVVLGMAAGIGGATAAAAATRNGQQKPPGAVTTPRG